MRGSRDYEFEIMREFGDSAIGYHSAHYLEDNSLDEWGEGEGEEWNSARVYLQDWNGEGLDDATYSDFDNLIVDDLEALNAAAGIAHATRFRVSDDTQVGRVLDLRDVLGIEPDNEFHLVSEDDGVYFQDINTPADTAMAIERSLSEGKDVYIPEEINYLPSNASENRGLLDSDCRMKIGSQLLADLLRNADLIGNYPEGISDLSGDNMVLTGLKKRHREVQEGENSGSTRAFPGRVVYSLLE